MKGIQQVTSIKEVKSMHSVGARSIPKAQRSAYLDLYINRREKDRLEKEIFVLDKRRNTAKRLLDSINKRIEKLQAETHGEQKIKTYRNIPTKPLKTLSIQY
ncbi:MAG: hypothetical protein KJ593_02320 [Candidatus Omnitrophica bacterium]|nr:hypothetical protein [Candidatus Omnitrophota bacterium]